MTPATFKDHAWVPLTLVALLSFPTTACSPGDTAAGDTAASDIPRTASGKPDLSGTYDIATLTPRERKPEFGDRLVLTDEEVADLVGREESRTEAGAKPSDPNRSAPEVGGRIGAYNDFYFERGTAPVFLDGEYRASLLVDPPNGRYPPLTERGVQRRQGMYSPYGGNYAELLEIIVDTGDAWWIDREVGPYDGPEVLAIADRCLLTLEATIPAMPKGYNNLKTIVQTDTHVMILIEWMHEARVIRLDSEHLPDVIRSRSGDSIGWWEGDTLVVDTTNFLEESWATSTIYGDPSPAHDQHVVERFTRIDNNTLRYEFTVSSSDYKVPFSGEYPWPATNDKLYEYACHEGNYAMEGILRGSRLLEREALAERGSATKQ